MGIFSLDCSLITCDPAHSACMLTGLDVKLLDCYDYEATESLALDEECQTVSKRSKICLEL